MKHQTHLENLSALKSILNKNTRFLSFSGIAGIIGGLVALAGLAVAVLYYNNHLEIDLNTKIPFQHGKVFLAIALSIIIVALGIGYWLTKKNMLKNGEELNSIVVKNALFNILIPIAVGGIVCVLAYLKGENLFIPAYMLLFYGLALFSGSKFTFDDLKIVAIVFIILGLLTFYQPNWSIYTWAIGFGFTHIVYGLRIYIQKERNL